MLVLPFGLVRFGLITREAIGIRFSNFMKTGWICLLALWNLGHCVLPARAAGVPSVSSSATQTGNLPASGLPSGLANSEWQKIRGAHAMAHSAAQPAGLGAPESPRRADPVAKADAVTQQAYLKASNTDALDGFGSSVAISGDTVVVGAPGESSNTKGVNGNASNNSSDSSGAVYVFVRTGGVWSQ